MMEDDMIIFKDKNVQLREMMCEMSEEIACKSQPTKWKLMEAYSQTLCRNAVRKADEMIVADTNEMKVR